MILTKTAKIYDYFRHKTCIFSCMMFNVLIEQIFENDKEKIEHRLFFVSILFSLLFDENHCVQL